MNAITKLTLALGTAALLAFPASSQAFDPPFRTEWNQPQHFHREGLRVISVGFHSPAARAGLERGDVILQVDGKIVRNFDQLHNALHRTGFRGTLTVRDARTGRVNLIRVFPVNGHIGITVIPAAF